MPRHEVAPGPVFRPRVAFVVLLPRNGESVPGWGWSRTIGVLVGHAGPTPPQVLGIGMPHRLHVLKVPTTRSSASMAENLFPYTHYADPGHDPTVVVEQEGSIVILRCRDRMKLKHNYMTRPANRLDVYMPGTGAAALAVDIVNITGPGNVAELAAVDPEAFLPYIREARQVRCLSCVVKISVFDV